MQNTHKWISIKHCKILEKLKRGVQNTQVGEDPTVAAMLS